jgi:hypothetical protein
MTDIDFSPRLAENSRAQQSDIPEINHKIPPLSTMNNFHTRIGRSPELDPIPQL